MDEEVSKVLRVILRPPMLEKAPQTQETGCCDQTRFQRYAEASSKIHFFSDGTQFKNLHPDVLQVLGGILGPLLLGKAPPRPRTLHLAIDFDSKKCIYRFPRCPEGSWELRAAVERN